MLSVDSCVTLSTIAIPGSTTSNVLYILHCDSFWNYTHDACRVVESSGRKCSQCPFPAERHQDRITGTSNQGEESETQLFFISISDTTMPSMIGSLRIPISAPLRLGKGKTLEFRYP